MKKTVIILLLLPSLAGALNATKIENILLRLLRQTRRTHRLPKLADNHKLQQLARFQSTQMARQNFFAHVDPQGRDPTQRMKMLFPEVIGGIGENIAYNYGNSDWEVAQKIFKAWMHSPGHRKNILSKKYNSIGIGVAFKDRRVYATQNFGTLFAELESVHPEKYQFGDSLTFNFHSLLPKKNKNLRVMVKFPDKKARYYLKNGTYYTGNAVFNPDWTDIAHFIVRMDLIYGHGTYRLFMGDSKGFYKGFLFTVN